MITRLYESRFHFFSVVFTSLLLLPGSGKAAWLVDNDVALGFEAGNQASGFSAKFPYNSSTSWQLSVGGGGAANSIGGRYISHFSEWKDSRVFWYGGLSAWFWSGNRFQGSETALGVSGGIGLDYDLTRIDEFTVPISVNFTIGPSYAAFSNYRGLDLLSIGIGIHYRFE